MGLMEQVDENMSEGSEKDEQQELEAEERAGENATEESGKESEEESSAMSIPDDKNDEAKSALDFEKPISEEMEDSTTVQTEEAGENVHMVEIPKVPSADVEVEEASEKIERVAQQDSDASATDDLEEGVQAEL